MHVLLTGATGFVGHYAAHALRAAGHRLTRAARAAHGPDAVAVDLAEPGAATALLRARAPDAVLNLAAVPDIAPCKHHPELARALNVELPAELARACARGVRLVHVSTDQVFDGREGAYDERAVPRPIHLYGETKHAGERAVLDLGGGAAVVRPGLVTGFAPAGRRSASSGLRAAAARAAAGEPGPGMFTDKRRSPIHASDLARALVALLERGELTGLFHAGGPEVLSRHELARRELLAWGLDPALLRRSTRAQAGLAHERPADLGLRSARLAEALDFAPGNPARDEPVPA